MKILSPILLCILSLFFCTCSNIIGTSQTEKDAMYEMLSLRYNEGTATLRSLQASLYEAIQKGLSQKSKINSDSIWNVIEGFHKDMRSADERAHYYISKLSTEQVKTQGLSKREWMQLANHFINIKKDIGQFCIEENNDTILPLKKTWDRLSISIRSFSDEDFLGNIFSTNGNNNSTAKLLLQSYRQQIASLEMTFLSTLTTALQETPILEPGYQILAQVSKPFVEPGENFEVELSVGKQDHHLDYEMSVNGTVLNKQDGKTWFRDRATDLGKHDYMVEVTFKNPITAVQEKLQKQFHYQVGKELATVTANNNNILYIGANNPITIEIEGLYTEKIEVTITGAGIDASIKQKEGNQYIARVTKPSSIRELAYINIINKEKQKIIGRYPFKVKRIPDPIPEVIFYAEKYIVKAGLMRQQDELKARIEDFDFYGISPYCDIKSFTLFYIPKGKPFVEITCIGSDFNTEIKQALKSAKSGDAYIFSKIKVSCPGDDYSRSISSLGYIIK